LGNFLEHLVGAQNPKGLKTPFKTTQPPAKSNPNNQKNNGSQSKNGFVPKIEEKNEKNEELGRNGFSGKKWGKTQMCGRRWVKWPERGRRWDGGWWGSDGWRWCVVFFWILGRM
jgi:hypothetical protein